MTDVLSGVASSSASTRESLALSQSFQIREAFARVLSVRAEGGDVEKTTFKFKFNCSEKEFELFCSEVLNKFLPTAGAGLQQFLGSKEFLMLGSFGATVLQNMAKQMAQQMIEEKK